MRHSEVVDVGSASNKNIKDPGSAFCTTIFAIVFYRMLDTRGHEMAPAPLYITSQFQAGRRGGGIKKSLSSQGLVCSFGKESSPLDLISQNWITWPPSDQLKMGMRSPSN